MNVCSMFIIPIIAIVVFEATFSRSREFLEDLSLRLPIPEASAGARVQFQQAREGHVGEVLQRVLVEVLPFRGRGRGQEERPWIIIIPDVRGFVKHPAVANCSSMAMSVSLVVASAARGG